MFGDELDILAMRLRHLDGIVHRHVIVESDVTFSGRPKPLYFAANRDRFREWAGKIIHIGVSRDDLPQGIDPFCSSPDPIMGLASLAWKREHAQREYCKRGIGGAAPRDLILHGDVDEIPAAGALRTLQRKPPAWPVALRMRNHVFAVDWLHPDPWHGTVAIAREDLKSIKSLRRKRNKTPDIRNGGWHFSWLGGPQGIADKNAVTSHQELAYLVDYANECGRLYEQGWAPWDEVQMKPVDVDESYPEYIWKRECPVIWFRPREQE